MINPTINEPQKSLNMYSYEKIEAMSHYLLGKTKQRPKIGIICGSGLGGLADQLEDKQVFSYNSIPDFPVSTVVGHAGALVFGTIKGVSTVVMKGRFHPYEGYPMWKCAMPVRVMKLLGIKILIVTNAAGGVNPSFKVGDIMIIKDHINMPGFAGSSPLNGPNDERWGPRFPPMNKAYDQELIKLVKRSSEELNMNKFMREGVYCMVGGPSFETVAEIRAIRTLGGDSVGMSTVHEVITAHHCGLRVVGFSLITNECVSDWDSNTEANHLEVLETGKKRAKDLEGLVSKVVETLAKQGL